MRTSFTRTNVFFTALSGYLSLQLLASPQPLSESTLGSVKDIITLTENAITDDPELAGYAQKQGYQRVVSVLDIAGPLCLDYYTVKVPRSSLPAGFNPHQMITTLYNNPKAVYSFLTKTLFNFDNERKVDRHMARGDVVNIGTYAGPDVAVIVRTINDYDIRLMTTENHPLSGQRMFAIRQDKDSFAFVNIGVSKPTDTLDRFRAMGWLPSLGFLNNPINLVGKWMHELLVRPYFTPLMSELVWQRQQADVANYFASLGIAENEITMAQWIKLSHNSIERNFVQQHAHNLSAALYHEFDFTAGTQTNLLADDFIQQGSSVAKN